MASTSTRPASSRIVEDTDAGPPLECRTTISGAALNKPVFNSGSHLEQLKEAGTDIQIISPRPYQLMHSEDPKLVKWWVEENNNVIAREAKMMPNVYRGVCALPHSPGVSPRRLHSRTGTMYRGLGMVAA